MARTLARGPQIGQFSPANRGFGVVETVSKSVACLGEARKARSAPCIHAQELKQDLEERILQGARCRVRRHEAAPRSHRVTRHQVLAVTPP